MLLDVDVRDGIVIDGGDHGLRVRGRACQRAETERGCEQDGKSSGALGEAGP